MSEDVGGAVVAPSMVSTVTAVHARPWWNAPLLAVTRHTLAPTATSLWLREDAR
jgi:hypothetical protein